MLGIIKEVPWGRFCGGKRRTSSFRQGVEMSRRDGRRPFEIGTEGWMGQIRHKEAGGRGFQEQGTGVSS